MKNESFLKQFEALIEDEDDLIALLANASAFLNQILDQINWVGFYLLKNNLLVLGPFQGKVACNRIPLNRGVCGKAARTLEIQRVKDVHEFKDHIACDSASESEIVLPIVKENKLIGVLDIDSPIKDRFSQDDQEFLEAITALIVKYI